MHGITTTNRQSGLLSQLESHRLRLFPLLFSALILSACGGSNNNSASTTSSAISSSSSLSSAAISSSQESSSSILSSAISSLSENSLSSQANSSVALISYKVNITSGDDQLVLTNSAFAEPLVLNVTTATGAPAVGVTVQFSVKSGTGTLSAPEVITNSKGDASVTVVAGATEGALHINASVVGGNGTGSFRHTVVAPDASANQKATVYNNTWSTLSHEKGSANYAQVFNQTSVNVLEIEMTSAQWQSIRDDMKVVFGNDFGSTNNGGTPGGGVPGGGFPGGELPSGEFPGGEIPGGGFPGGELPNGELPDGEFPGGGGGLNFSSTDPAYVPVTVSYNNKIWKKVGFRLKGNSSLTSAWGSGNYKLPFRLKTTEFGDVYSAVKGQRFYGFKDISFSPGYSDNSLIREKLGSDLFRAAGIPAARTAFARVYINFGEGKKYCGVYTIVEVIDDTMVKTEFGNDDGNIYKPESTFANFVATEFEKKSNKDEADYSDVQAVITVLNSSLRTTNPAEWRKQLEAVFNVDHFLKWLAINTAIVSWDAYGRMAHNFYLYNDPQKKLTWIPWDLNMSLSGNPGVEASTSTGNIGGGISQGLSLSLKEVTNAWPLIRYLADDEVYYARYKEHMKAFNNGSFNQTELDAKIDQYYELITPFVVGENGEQTGYTYTTPDNFNAAKAELKTHIQERKALIPTFVP
jgi:spore coat protein CotH